MALRIVVISDRTWPCDHAFLEEVIAKKLPSRGHHVSCVMPTLDPRAAGTHIWHGATAEAIYGSNRVLRQYRICKYLRKLLQKIECDVLLVRNDSITGTFARYCKNIPMVFQLSHQKEETILIQKNCMRKIGNILICITAKIGILFRRHIMKIADMVLPISISMLTVLQRTGERQSGMIPVPLGASSNVSCTGLSPEVLRKRLGISKDEIMLLYLGTLNSVRRLNALIDAIYYLYQYGQPAVLVFVGEGSSPNDRKHLEQYACEMGVDRHVHFVGRIPRRETIDYILAADYGISYFPSIPLFQQNSPTKVMEYLAHGLPVVCTPQPEQQYIVEQCNAGIISDSDDPRDFASAIISAIHANWNKNMIRDDFLELRSFDVITDIVENALIEVVDNRARA